MFEALGNKLLGNLSLKGSCVATAPTTHTKVHQSHDFANNCLGIGEMGSKLCSWLQ